MKINREASAIWNGTGKGGSGTVSTESGALKNIAYDYKSRFEEGPLTNPEELVGAAHAGCFSMKLSFILEKNGFTPEKIETKAIVTLEDGAIQEVHLKTKVKASGLDDEKKMKELVDEAKETCPISKSLSAKISVEAEMG
jgi:osmotically inducible protein OsmC